MSTFINVYIGEPTPVTYIKKHLIYSILWLIDIGVLLFRLDTYLLKDLNINSSFLSTVIPLFVIAINISLLINQKWYYSLAFISYPFLLILWFIPKLILEKGKLYLFLYYLTTILKYLTQFKKSLIQFAILILVIILLLTTNSDSIRVLGICYFGYLYLMTLFNYIIGSVRKQITKPGLKGGSLSKLNLIESLEKLKGDEKLTPEQNLSNKIKIMVLWTYFLQYVTDNVNGYRGKRAFMIVWFFQYFFCFFLTLIFFTFFNYQLFKISPHSFIYTTQPDLFDFFYYTFKNITFSSVDSLKPFSKIARVIEMSSFFILAIWLLIITVSSILSLKVSEYSKEVENAVKLCAIQNEKMEEHLKMKYNTDINKAILEIETIKTAVYKLKNILERIL